MFFFSSSTILTILPQQWPGYLEAKERTLWRRRRPMKMRDPRFVSRQDLLKELTYSDGKVTFQLWNAILLVLTISIARENDQTFIQCVLRKHKYTMWQFVSIILTHVAIERHININCYYSYFKYELVWNISNLNFELWA